MERKILVNQIRTPDGTILISHHRHDYKTYIDKNGLEYMVDGGQDYLRRNVHKDDLYEEMSLYDDTPIEELREAVHRGGRGKDGTEPLKYVLLKDMSNEWINNVLIYENKYRPHNIYISVFTAELIYRVKNKIFIED